ncbi:unnamed protein product [Mytilus coruscus]|uniref:Uncharacterized protein n=1 Tax=Mytilus coruscus TaxID=42192 RepID=A0A6J8EAM7_MYTCO|nr:unnamed protein product [Mytilus coruscus]
MSLKSGDKVANNINNIYGTVGLSLRDITHHYCVTCKHVIEDCLEASNGIPTPEYDANEIFIKTEVGNVGTDKIYTPSHDLDFSAVRLVGNNIPISSRLRQRDGGLVNGGLFGRDMLLLPYNTLLYKWGAASGLTTGRYIGRREQIDQPPLFTIQSESPEVFAIGGDSGSLVCYSTNGFEIAAIILTGRLENDEDLFVGYKLKDALESCTMISPDIRECIRQH